MSEEANPQITQITQREEKQPYDLWKRADRETKGDARKFGRRYRELLIEHGHLVPGKPRALSCGWFGSKGKAK